MRQKFGYPGYPSYIYVFECFELLKFKNKGYMSNLKEVLEFIKNSDLQEFNSIKNAVSIRKSELAYDAKLSFRIGDMVGIDHKKISPSETFKVTKINSKNIKVQGDRGSYTVAPSLLVKKVFTTEVYS